MPVWWGFPPESTRHPTHGYGRRAPASAWSSGPDRPSDSSAAPAPRSAVADTAALPDPVSQPHSIRSLTGSTRPAIHTSPPTSSAASDDPRSPHGRVASTGFL